MDSTTSEDQHVPCNVLTEHHVNVIHDSPNLKLLKPDLKSDPLLKYASVVEPTWAPDRHFYPTVPNSTIHPTAKTFFNLGNMEIIRRYCQMHPEVNEEILKGYLHYKPKYIFWAGADLFNVVTKSGERKMIIVENGSCPAGQKSMPSKNNDVYSGYHTVMEIFFAYAQKHSNSELGGLAMIYDKNEMEAHGYASTLSSISKEPVWMVEYAESDPNPPVKWTQDLMHVRDEHSAWHPVRAAFKYVTHKPWKRIPLNSRTLMVNSILACLSGGRNKVMGFHAYAQFNEELRSSGSGLQIDLPETVVNVKHDEIEAIIKQMGGRGVIKMPYSNGGQGVFTIVNSDDMNAFMSSVQLYERYVVQSLVEPLPWMSSEPCYPNPASEQVKYYHVGTLPDEAKESFVNDIRMMVCCGENGFVPVSMFSRRARKPIAPLSRNRDSISTLHKSSSWDMLGTNLTIKNDVCFMKNTEADRLLMFDTKDFERLNLDLNDLVTGYVQTILSVISIDKACIKLVEPNGEFNEELFKQLNPDTTFMKELNI